MTEQFSHIYKATDKIVVLCRLIFTFTFCIKNETFACSLLCKEGRDKSDVK